MPITINHFMWGYQPHFRVSQEAAAKRVFELLDGRFNPEIFFVGILIDNLKDCYPACVEPENDFWIQSETFNSTLEIAGNIYTSYPEKNILHSHQLAQKSHDESLFRRSIKDAIKKIVDDEKTTPSSVSYFVSNPSKVNGYLVCAVLKLQKTVIASHQSLTISQVPIHEYSSMPVAISLIDAAIIIFLEKVSGELNLPDPGKNTSSFNAEEVIREAANKFMMGLAYRADDRCIEGWHSLFSECNSIAASFYEKAAGKGSFLLAEKKHPAIQTFVEFTYPTKLKVTRGARKLLELASKDYAMHTDSEKIYGLVNSKVLPVTDEDIFKINILEHHHWEVTYAGNVLMRVKYGQPYLPKPSFNEEKLRNDLPRIFNKITNKQINRIVGLVREAEREKHGTMLLISKDAKNEAQRLGNQATPIKPKILTPKILRNLTPIDGALLLNPKGTCYAIGAILDGMTVKDGDPARGARYNSAIRYIVTSKIPSIAIVISEDGGIDFIPDLKPAIRESELIKAINTLKKLSESASINRRKYYETMEWLGEHRFYLLNKHCIELNKLKVLIEKKIEIEDPMAMRIIRNKFIPNHTMDTDLYYVN
ncbi:MAG: DNA integrity scanning protein DisA nucleotide-binding domain protein [Desulfobacteraceae bacterium]|nr:DNA integrity scanning protein DisA nucleotide-binding domain protein [Desulfobacteraceae bacterium]